MARPRTLRTEAIVMRRVDHGEADRLLTLYTREFGKLKAIAKGSRKPQSRKTGHVELFMRTQFLLAAGRGAYYIATQADGEEPYEALRHDLVRTTYAAYAVELLDKFTGDEDKNVTLYELLSDGISRFAHEENLLLAARYYELRLLSIAGFQPQLFRCVESGELIEQEDQFFSAELGGFLRPDQRHADRRSKPITAGAVKVLRYLQTRSWDTVQSLQLRTPLHRELEAILHYYLVYHLERSLRSTDFLHRLRREASLFADESPPDQS